MRIPEKVIHDGERFSVAVIDDSVFMGCTGLTVIELPETLHSIGDHAFDDCSSLRTLIVHCDSLDYAHQAFGGSTKIDSLIIGAHVRWLSPYIFSALNKIETVIFNAKHGVEMRNLFFGNPAPTTLIVGEEVSCIPPFLCYNFSGLRRVVYAGTALSAIGECAFVNCRELRTLVIPKGMDDLGAFAFAHCDPQYIIFESQNPPRMRGNPFYGIEPYIEVSVPCGSRQHYVNTIVGNYFNELQYPDDCPLIHSGEVLYIHDTVWLHDTVYVTSDDISDIADRQEERLIDWLRIEDKVLHVIRPDRLAGRTYIIFDHNGRQLLQGQVPQASSDDYLIRLPRRKRYYIGFEGETPVLVDVPAQEVK